MLHASYFTLSYFVVVREARGRRVHGPSFFRLLRGMRLTQLFASAPFPLPSLLPSLRVVSFPDTTHFLCSARRTCQTEAGSFASYRPSLVSLVRFVLILASCKTGRASHVEKKICAAKIRRAFCVGYITEHPTCKEQKCSLARTLEPSEDLFPPSSQ